MNQIQTLDIGSIIDVDGRDIKIKCIRNSNATEYSYNNVKYNNYSIGSFIAIPKQNFKLIARVEREYLVELKNPSMNVQYQTEILVKLVGFIENGIFYQGTKIFPHINDRAVFLSDEEVVCIYTGQSRKNSNLLYVGKTVNEGIDIPIVWSEIFKTNIGIFGNSGSGKSNTLAKMYTELFSKNLKINKSSTFYFFDFNGEYIGKNTLTKSKNVYILSTSDSKGDKIQFPKTFFLDPDVISILLSATTHTQKPFITKTLLTHKDYILDNNEEKMFISIRNAFENIFTSSNAKDAYNLLLQVINLFKQKLEVSTILSFENYTWNAQTQNFVFVGETISQNINAYSIKELSKKFYSELIKNFSGVIAKLEIIDKLMIALQLQLIDNIKFSKIEYNFICPIITRLKAIEQYLKYTIEIVDDKDLDEYVFNVISLRDCNHAIKKIIPLLVAKYTYNYHKLNVENNNITETFHLIIDEAHNILTETLKREEEIYEDYSLSIFEEIVKEGRKYGYFLTISTQRPADIAQTIMSQLHNFFIHRLINDKDLNMLSNTIETLDNITKSTIPSLSPGQCIMTGNSFDLPLLMNITRLDKKLAPLSENVDLIKLWS